MGFMGFGMRKEVYTRKAQKAFVKIKEVYREGTALPSSNIKFKTNDKVSYQKHDYKPFYESKIYKTIKLIVIAIFFITLMWNLFILP